MIDFTDCPVDDDFIYGGANGKKIGIRYAGHIYMLKFPPRSHAKYQNGGYANSCISEHLGCQIFKSIGMDAQDTILGTFTDGRGVTKTVVACRDFTEGGKRFRPFLEVKNSCLSSDDSGAGTELGDVLSSLGEQRYVDSERAIAFFWDMFVVDALVGNFDRHNGNWGLLKDADGQWSIAPVFDCGSCLYPQLPEWDYRRILDDRKEIDIRLYRRPESALLQNGRRIPYLDFLASDRNPDCSDALRRIHPRVDMDRIHDIIEGCEGLNDLQKEFYQTMVTERKEKILDAALDRLESSDQPEPRCQRPRDRSQRGGCLQREAPGGDVEVVAGDLHDVLGDAVRTYAEQERDALAALDHLGHLPERELPLRVRPAGGEDNLPQLGRETLPRIREAVEPAGLRHLQEVLPVATDARGPCDPFRDLHGRAGILRDREAEEGETHVVRPREVPCAGYDAPVGLPEVLVVRVVESYRDPSASHRPVLLRPTMA